MWRNNVIIYILVTCHSVTHRSAILRAVVSSEWSAGNQRLQQKSGSWASVSGSLVILTPSTRLKTKQPAVFISLSLSLLCWTFMNNSSALVSIFSLSLSPVERPASLFERELLIVRSSREGLEICRPDGSHARRKSATGSQGGWGPAGHYARIGLGSVCTNLFPPGGSNSDVEDWSGVLLQFSSATDNAAG